MTGRGARPVLGSTAVFLLVAVAAGDGRPAALPAGWHGVWAGTMTSTSPADKATEVPLVLAIEPIAGSADLTWKAMFGTGDKAVVKDYRLVPEKDAPGRFKIDERNGSVLDARLVGGVLHSVFETGGIVFTARYELRGDAIRYELTTAKRGDKTAAGQVQNYRVEVVQAAELRKK